MVGEKKRILVVDESWLVRSKIREELEAGRFEVIEARDGGEALRYLRSDVPPDLITMDIEIHRTASFETIMKLRRHSEGEAPAVERCPSVPVVFITGNDTMEDRKRGFEMGAVEFVSKPLKEGEMVAVVSKILCPDNTERDISALVADDSVVSRTVAKACLEREGIRVVEAEDGAQAFEILRKNKDAFDIVITDMIMPVMDGKVLCRKIRKELFITDMPVIFLTAVSEMSELLEVFKAGASDYLVKPFAKEELLARSMVHIERNRINKKLRETILSLEKANEDIRRLSIMDPLTGSYNRGYLNMEMPKEIRRAQRYQRALSILFCDIDHFKRVNDTYGHQAGDHTLVQVVRRLKRVTRRDIDWIARYGGEEFIVVLPETTLDAAWIVGEKLRKTVTAAPVHFREHRISITASFGVAGFDPQAGGELSMDDLLRDADRSMHQAKQNGRNQVTMSG